MSEDAIIEKLERIDGEHPVTCVECGHVGKVFIPTDKAPDVKAWGEELVALAVALGQADSRDRIATLEADVSRLTASLAQYACVECPENDNNDAARGYCPRHGTEMRDRVDRLEGAMTFVEDAREEGKRDADAALRARVVELEASVVKLSGQLLGERCKTAELEGRLGEATGLVRDLERILCDVTRLALSEHDLSVTLPAARRFLYPSDFPPLAASPASAPVTATPARCEHGQPARCPYCSAIAHAQAGVLKSLLSRWINQHKDGGQTDPCGVSPALVAETKEAMRNEWDNADAPSAPPAAPGGPTKRLDEATALLRAGYESFDNAKWWDDQVRVFLGEPKRAPPLEPGCSCGHSLEEHGNDSEYPGSTACSECDCIAFEAPGGPKEEP